MTQVFQKCIGLELEAFKSMKMRKITLFVHFHASQPMSRAFRICKNISSIPSGTHATPILVIFGTSCTVLATVPNRIRNFDFFFSECIPWTHTQLWVPQTWSSVNPLDHKKAYKTVPLQILVSVHLTQQYCFGTFSCLKASCE